MPCARNFPQLVGIRFSTALLAFMLATVTQLSAQPIIDDEDIVNASEELRDLLYERHELKQELGDLDREQNDLKSRLAILNELVRQQKKLDAIIEQIDLAEEAGNEKAIETLEKEANALEQTIELSHDLREIDEQIQEAKEIANRLSELIEIPIASKLSQRITADITVLLRVRAATSELRKLSSSDAPRSQSEPIEKQVDSLYEQLDEHEAIIEIAVELFEAFEEEHEDAVEELMEEATELLGEAKEDPDESASKRETIDPKSLPVLVTAETLADFADADFFTVVAPLLKQHCVDCHGNDSSSGELNLEQMLNTRPLVTNRDKWINVIEQVKNRVMPPEDEPPLEEGIRRKIVLATHQTIYNFDYSSVKDPGFEVTRRLTHAEYDNTIRDLFGVELELAQRFPDDLSGTSGFDNSANTLFLHPLLMERYIGAADHIVSNLLPETVETAKQQKARARIFFISPASVDEERDIAAGVLKRFVSRAYRRPLSKQEMSGLIRSYQDGRGKGLDHESSIRAIVRTTLISPHFLLKSEAQPGSNADHRVNNWELASRLSYFIWASMPDDELFRLAKAQRLHQPDVLTEQIDRMIDDPRSNTLGTLFAAQWLGSQHLGTRVRLDPIDNPWCTESLMSAMRTETAMFFHSLVRENKPIEHLVSANYTFLNDELAKLYKIRGVAGDEMRRVDLTSDRRGGILGHGSLLAVTSFPYRTSPVVRGKWVLDTLLGTPPPPPPPNVSEFSDDIEEKRRLTIKQKLALHRSSPNCYACHSQMDPLGLSLENYDWFGRWRENYGRKKIDNQGTLPNGRMFKGLSGLKQVIIDERSDDLVRQVTMKMLSYALGRQLEYYDEPAIREIIVNVGERENRFRPLIHSIATSYPFQFKRNRAGAAAAQTTAKGSP